MTVTYPSLDVSFNLGKLFPPAPSKRCTAPLGNWICTRPLGHDGQHIAHGSDGRAIATWDGRRTPAAREARP